MDGGRNNIPASWIFLGLRVERLHHHDQHKLPLLLYVRVV